MTKFDLPVTTSRWPLWLQVNLVMLILTISVTAVAGWIIHRKEITYQLESIEKQARQVLSVLCATSMDAMIANDRPILETMISETVKSNKNIDGLYFFDRFGRTLAFWHGETDKTNHVVRFKQDVVFQQELFGNIEIEWKLDKDEEIIGHHIGGIQTIIVASLLLLSSAVTIAFHFLAISPINSISRRLKDLASGNYNAPRNKGHSQEISRLNHSVNTLADALAEQHANAKEQKDTLERLVTKRTSELNKLYEQMKQQALHDPLTGLPNRVLLIDRLTQAVARSKRNGTITAVFFIDIDRFKSINDTYGHLVGDELIKIVAKQIRETIRAEDTVARFAGDEFACVLYDIKEKSNAAAIAKKIAEAISKPLRVNEFSIDISASIGIAICPENGEDPETLLKNADVAMYQAKSNATPRYEFFCEDIGFLSQRKNHLEKDLRCIPKNQQLQIHYQPIHNLSSKKIVAVEALVRWEHPKLGLLSPIEFISLAEELGTIQDIDLWVLENACKEVHKFNIQHRKNLYVSVNFSSKNFESTDLISKIGHIMQSMGNSRPDIQIEITENTYLKESNTVIENINQLKASGFRIAVDDFGAGYASFSYLTRLPIDAVKIDKHFLNSLKNNKNSQTVAQAIINLGNKLGLTVIAEGVEHFEQENFLIKHRCNTAQGFLYGRPQNIVHLERAIENNE